MKKFGKSIVAKFRNFMIYCTTIWKFTNPKRRNSEISRLIAERIGKVQIHWGNIWKFEDLQHKNLEFSNPVHKNLETYKSIMKNQLLRKIWKFTN